MGRICGRRSRQPNTRPQEAGSCDCARRKVTLLNESMRAGGAEPSIPSHSCNPPGRSASDPVRFSDYPEKGQLHDVKLDVGRGGAERGNTTPSTRATCESMASWISPRPHYGRSK